MAYATPEKVRVYREHLAGVVLPELRKLQGFQGLDLCETPRGDQVELLIISRWQSMEAVRAFAGPDPDRAVVEPGAKAVLAEYDDFVTNYEVTLEAMGV
jgi:heme-degrading monooxygenase HmoA